MANEQLARLAANLADIAEQFDAPRVARLIEECGFRGSNRDDIFCSVADELGQRGRDGLRSQVLAYRFGDKEVA